MGLNPKTFSASPAAGSCAPIPDHPVGTSSFRCPCNTSPTYVRVPADEVAIIAPSPGSSVCCKSDHAPLVYVIVAPQALELRSYFQKLMILVLPAKTAGIRLSVA